MGKNGFVANRQKLAFPNASFELDVDTALQFLLGWGRNGRFVGGA